MLATTFTECREGKIMSRKEMTIEEKAQWYDALCEVLSMGFDLQKNSAEDLICTTNELLSLRETDKLS